MYFAHGDNGDIKLEDIRFDSRDFENLRNLGGGGTSQNSEPRYDPRWEPQFQSPYITDAERYGSSSEEVGIYSGAVVSFAESILPLFMTVMILCGLFYLGSQIFPAIGGSILNAILSVLAFIGKSTFDIIFSLFA